jgi:hypothetical protein
MHLALETTGRFISRTITASTLAPPAAGEHDVAHRALWLQAGGFSDLEQQSFLAVDPLDPLGECLEHPPLGLAADLVDDLEQQMTGPFLHKKDQCANLTLTNRVTRPAWHIQSEPTYVRRIRFSKRP